MTKQQNLSSALLGFTVLLLAVKPSFEIALVASVLALHTSFLHWLDKHRVNEKNALEGQIKAIKDRVERLEIQKGFSR